MYSRVARRVVVTGVGGLCGLGPSAAHIFARLVHGHSSTGTLGSSGALSRLAATFGSSLGELDPYADVVAAPYCDDFWHNASIADSSVLIANRTDSRATRFAIVAACEALQSARLFATDAHRHTSATTAPCDPSEPPSRWRAGHFDRLLAGPEALRFAPDVDCSRIAVVVGTGMGALEATAEAAAKTSNGQARRISPWFITQSLPSAPATAVAMLFGCEGGSLAPATACAAGAHAVATAAELVRSGGATIALAGGADAMIHPIGIGGFRANKALYPSSPALRTAFAARMAASVPNPFPASGRAGGASEGDLAAEYISHAASRPFDVDHNGLVMGEGAAVLVLESLASAQRRGAPILAEYFGGGSSSDVHHVTQPHPDGVGACRAMLHAWQDAEPLLQLEDCCVPQYVNAHATSTPVGDVSELRGIASALYSRAGSQNKGLKSLVGSTKGAHGHLLGAAGALEALIAVLSLSTSIVPGNCHLSNPLPGYSLDEDCGGDLQLSADPYASEGQWRSAPGRWCAPHSHAPAPSPPSSCSSSEPSAALDSPPTPCPPFLLAGQRSKKNKDLTVAQSNSLGFGGTNCSLLFRAPRP